MELYNVPPAPSPCLHISLAGYLVFIPFILFKASQSDRSFPRFHLGRQSSRKQITPGMSNGIESVSSRWVANLNLAQASSDWNSSPHGREIYSLSTPRPWLFLPGLDDKCPCHNTCPIISINWQPAPYQVLRKGLEVIFITLYKGRFQRFIIISPHRVNQYRFMDKRRGFFSDHDHNPMGWSWESCFLTWMGLLGLCIYILRIILMGIFY